MAHELTAVSAFGDGLMELICEEEKDQSKDKKANKPSRPISGKWCYSNESVGRSASGDGLVRGKRSRGD